MSLLKKFFIVCLSFLFLSQLPAFAAGSGDKTLTIYTSILPQRYFVEKIGGDRVNVDVLVGPGKSPATYEPTPQQVMGLGSADALFTLGVPFEAAFLPAIKSSVPQLKLVDTAAGIQRRTLKIAHDHDEDTHEEHADEYEYRDHAAKDPHIWLSPRLVKVQASNIYNALIQMDPEGADNYKQGYDTLIEALDQIDAKLTQLLAPFDGNTMFVFHPSFGYFGDDYGLRQIAIETGGKTPSPSALVNIIEHAKEERVKIIFVQPEFSQSSARAIAEAIDGAVVTLAPLNPDYINNLSQMAAELEKAFR